MARNARDHGGGLDAAVAQFGGQKGDWLDLSTGINPTPFPLPDFVPADWTALPDTGADHAACAAARQFWNVPEGADILAVPGCSAPIAMIPGLHPVATVEIAGPTYNEHAAAFRFHGWQIHEHLEDPSARVIVNPNNPTGDFHTAPPPAPLTIIDESFCDVDPTRSLIAQADKPGHLILKSFGKFWGLAGLRLGFVIGDPDLVDGLRQRIGPWPVSGPALRIAQAALKDTTWAQNTRTQLTQDATRLDQAMDRIGASPIGDTPLFRTYSVADAAQLQDHLARHHIWSRIFPYSDTWIRLGLPPADRWDQIDRAL